MNPEDIKKLVQAALSRASNFHCVDLQIHSDESGDFPRICDFGDIQFKPSDADATPVAPESVLKAAKDKGLHLIAITDHMKSRKSCEIAEVSEQSDLGVVALPAIEVAVSLSQVSRSTKDSVHLLCIFKEGKKSEDIERIFNGCKGLNSYESRVDGDVIEIDLRDFVQQVHQNDGICIASHVNAEKGLRKSFFSLSHVDFVLCSQELKVLAEEESKQGLTGETQARREQLLGVQKRLADEIQNAYLAFLVEARIDAVQIQKSSEGQFYSGEHCEALGIPPIAAVLTTDAHCLEAIGYEKKITYVKMTKCSWADLKLALQDPDTRIRYADNVSTRRFPKIKGLVFVTTDGFFRPLQGNSRMVPQVLGFSDNLSCLIGGRGAGKSATVDALRYMFKDREEVDQLPNQLKQDIYGRLDHALKDTAIFVLLEAEDGEEIVVKSFYTDWPSRTYESRFLSGEDAGVDLSTSSKFKAQIYGWNEIETLGTDSAKQLSLLDNFIEDLHGIAEAVRSKKLDLAKSRLHVAQLSETLETSIPLMKDFSEAKSAYEKTNTPEMQASFAEIDALAKKEKSFKEIREALADINTEIECEGDLAGRLHDLSVRIADPNLRTRIFGKDDAEISEADLHYQSLRTSLTQFIARLDAEIVAASSDITIATENLAKVLGSDVQGLATVEKRSARKTKYEQLVEQKARIKKQRELLESALNDRNQILGEYVELQKVRSQKRADTRDEINQKLADAIKRGPEIRINFEALGDRTEFQRKLGVARTAPATQKEVGLLKGVSLKYMERRIAEILSSLMNPVEFVGYLLEGRTDCFSGRHPDGKDEINNEESSKIAAYLSPRVTEYDESYFDTAKLRQLMEVQEIELNDIPEITLDGQPIRNLSPGQRCSALIPIILLQGNHPLIIDQPEDNLDNKLVFGLVVEILRNLKEFRQIIVATHNPNIPVSGDAEQIAVFESIDKHSGKIAMQGSIEDSEIVEAVKDIMEGGEQAFLIRARKYRYEFRP
jgi:DNA repair ATPase RecN/PHP family Zn ribbon phosphoesterase